MMKHFTIDELTRSETARRLGLDNTLSEEHRRNIELTVHEMLDPLREAWAVRCANQQWGSPAIRVTSGYRGFRLNKAVGGSNTSAHCIGFAFDLVPGNGRLLEFKRFCREWLTGRPFDQLISEDENTVGVPRWMHIGYMSHTKQQRRQFLSMRNGKYLPLTA